jgi:molecular chaperone HtpG
MLQRMKADDLDMTDWATLLFEQSLLAEGGQLEDPAGFVRRMNRLMLQGAPTA